MELSRSYVRNILQKGGRLVYVGEPCTLVRKFNEQLLKSWPNQVYVLRDIGELYGIHKALHFCKVLFVVPDEDWTKEDNETRLNIDRILLSHQVFRQIAELPETGKGLAWNGLSVKSLALENHRVYFPHINETDSKVASSWNGHVVDDPLDIMLVVFPRLGKASAAKKTSVIRNVVPWRAIITAVAKGAKVVGYEWIRALRKGWMKDPLHEFQESAMLFDATVILPPDLTEDVRKSLEEGLDRFGASTASQISDGCILVSDQGNCTLTTHFNVAQITTMKEANVEVINLGWLKNVVEAGKIVNLTGAFPPYPRHQPFNRSPHGSVHGQRFQNYNTNEFVGKHLSAIEKEFAATLVDPKDEHQVRKVDHVISSGVIFEPGHENCRTLHCLTQWLRDGAPHTDCPMSHIPIYVPACKKMIFKGVIFCFVALGSMEALNAAAALKAMGAGFTDRLQKSMDRAKTIILWDGCHDKLEIKNMLSEPGNPPIYGLGYVRDYILKEREIAIQQNKITLENMDRIFDCVKEEKLGKRPLQVLNKKEREEIYSMERRIHKNNIRQTLTQSPIAAADKKPLPKPTRLNDQLLVGTKPATSGNARLVLVTPDNIVKSPAAPVPCATTAGRSPGICSKTRHSTCKMSTAKSSNVAVPVMKSLKPNQTTVTVGSGGMAPSSLSNAGVMTTKPVQTASRISNALPIILKKAKPASHTANQTKRIRMDITANCSSSEYNLSLPGSPKSQSKSDRDAEIPKEAQSSPQYFSSQSLVAPNSSVSVIQPSPDVLPTSQSSEVMCGQITPLSANKEKFPVEIVMHPVSDLRKSIKTFAPYLEKMLRLKLSDLAMDLKLDCDITAHDISVMLWNPAIGKGFCAISDKPLNSRAYSLAYGFWIAPGEAELSKWLENTKESFLKFLRLCGFEPLVLYTENGVVFAAPCGFQGNVAVIKLYWNMAHHVKFDISANLLDCMEKMDWPASSFVHPKAVLRCTSATEGCPCSTLTSNNAVMTRLDFDEPLSEDLLKVTPLVVYCSGRGSQTPDGAMILECVENGIPALESHEQQKNGQLCYSRALKDIDPLVILIGRDRALTRMRCYECIYCDKCYAENNAPDVVDGFLRAPWKCSNVDCTHTQQEKFYLAARVAYKLV